jgi:signal transduction histidine kinase
VNPLRLLLLEDSDRDAERILAHLAEGAFDCRAVRARTRDEFVAGLGDCPHDLILSDFSPPSFDGLAALKLAREACPDVPFLFVSGATGEEVAVEALKSGATDYVLKQRLDRLVPAVRRALAEARERAERRRLEAQLRRQAEELALAARRKDEFLAVLAHELRNPLAPVRNALQIMRLHGTADPTLGQARAIIERQVQHLGRLVDDLLDVSRIGRGKVQLKKERVELSAVVAAALEVARPLIEKRQHRLTVTLAPDPLWLDADFVRLEQVVTNLLTNAAKYTDPGGDIRVSTAVEGGEAVLRVRDTGIGIPPAMRPRIFDLFMQADSSAHRTQGGLGVGLTLVKRLVEMHGGSVGVTSAGVGQGSEFVVRLPLAGAREDPAAPPAAPAEAVQPPGRPKRVMVVDDNKDGADSLAMLVRLWGHDALLAYDGDSALKKAEAEQPDVVLLDIGLPGLDGYQVARRLRERSAEHPVLVALTGYGKEEDRRRSREAGFNHHLTKPVDPDALQRLLAGGPAG